MPFTRRDMLEYLPFDGLTRADGIRIIGYKELDKSLMLVTSQKFNSSLENIVIFINNPNWEGDSAIREIKEELDRGNVVTIDLWLTKRNNRNISTAKKFPYIFSVSSEEAGIKIVAKEPRKYYYPKSANDATEAQPKQQPKIEDFDSLNRK
ncbi:MAG: hypothetical protein ACP5K9_01105 [Candidatus Micrarchaeia archaeon]